MKIGWLHLHCTMGGLLLRSLPIFPYSFSIVLGRMGRLLLFQAAGANPAEFTNEQRSEYADPSIAGMEWSLEVRRQKVAPLSPIGRRDIRNSSASNLFQRQRK